MVARRIFLVVLILILFAGFTFFGILYVDHQTRQISFGETMPFLWIIREGDSVILNLHVFGEVRILDFTRLFSFWKSTEDFIKEYGAPVR